MVTWCKHNASGPPCHKCDDEELADRIVEILSGRKPDHKYGWYIMAGSDDLSAEQFIQDGRVVVALMEKCEFLEIEQDFHMEKETLYWAVRVLVNDDWCARNESLPRAITEACASALSTGSSGK